MATEALRPQSVLLVYVLAVTLFIIGTAAGVVVDSVWFTPNHIDYRYQLYQIFNLLWIAPFLTLPFVRVRYSKLKAIAAIAIFFVLMIFMLAVTPTHVAEDCELIDRISDYEVIQVCNLRPSGQATFRASVGSITMELLEVLE